MLVNPVHEFPRTMALIGNFLNLGIEKSSLSGLDNTLEQFPIFKASRFSVSVKRLLTIFILPYFGILHDLGSSGIRILYLFDTSS